MNKKLGLTFEFQNGDNGENYYEGNASENIGVYEIDLQEGRLSDSLAQWLEDRKPKSLVKFCINLMGNPDMDDCGEYGLMFNQLREMFYRIGVEKLGWGDIMVRIDDIVVDGEIIYLSEYEHETLENNCKIQLARCDPDWPMYMIDPVWE